MALTPEQKRIVSLIIGEGRRRNLPVGGRRVVSAIETGLVESGLRNLSGGDADSQGWRQERSSLYPNPRDLRASIRRYFDEAKQFDTGRGSAGELAARVQRPASQYRGRYDQRRADALAIVRAYGGAPARTEGLGAQPLASAASGAAGGAAGQIPGLGGGTDVSALLKALSDRQAPSSAGLALPAFAAGPPTPKGYQLPVSGGGPASKPNIDELLGLIQPGASVDTPQPAAPDTATPDVPSVGGGQPPRTAGGGRVIVAPGAERPGIGLQKPIRSFLRELAGRSGRPVTVTTGTNHNRLTTNGNVSDHWGGNASDLGVGGDARSDAAAAAKGDRIAAHAISIAAGVSYAKALAIARQGGIHNFNTKRGRVQIIWRVDGAANGGNHFNHVHIGVNPNR